MSAYYKLDKIKKRITVDLNVDPEKGEKDMVNYYMTQGYELKRKSKKKSKAMKTKSDTLTKEQIIKELKDDKEALKKFNDILAGKAEGYSKGFFAAKSWYKSRNKK